MEASGEVGSYARPWCCLTSIFVVIPLMIGLEPCCLNWDSNLPPSVPISLGFACCRIQFCSWACVLAKVPSQIPYQRDTRLSGSHAAALESHCEKTSKAWGGGVLTRTPIGSLRFARSDVDPARLPQQAQVPPMTLEIKKIVT